MEELREDERHTRCRTCGFVKANYLFTPGELRRPNPHCRKCVKVRNDATLANPGAPMGHALRGKKW
jgi:hypothetical protein